ncbi:MAG: ABC transporter ATP-binding protein [Clostridia bacterium]|nr:ABC transporter ATP-binding protein [Clostridia bacterium]
MIILQNVNKRYENKVILSNLCLEIPSGEFTALMGASGVGKTTLSRLLLGLEEPDGGSVTGVPERRAAVFQEDRLIPSLSAVQNVRLGKRGATRAAAQRLLSALGLEKDAEKPASALSGGMRRRVAIARALLADADFYLLDEPFSGLDDETKAQVMDVVKRALAGKTVLLITHDEAEARFFTERVLYL